MSTLNGSTRLTALGCVVLAGSLLLPPPAAAEPAAATPSITATARRLAAREAAAMKERQGAQAPAPTTDLRSGSFFKTPAGIATLVIVGVGTAYAAYSASNDRIKSPGR
jgi:hypothetical protein